MTTIVVIAGCVLIGYFVVSWFYAADNRYFNQAPPKDDKHDS